MDSDQIIKDLIYALDIARDRAVRHGKRLVEVGLADINRGQFEALCDGVKERAERHLSARGAKDHECEMHLIPIEGCCV